MQQRAFSDDPMTERYLSGEVDDSADTETDAYPAHWTAGGSRLSQQLANLDDDQLLTTINAALERRRNK